MTAVIGTLLILTLLVIGVIALMARARYKKYSLSPTHTESQVVQIASDYAINQGWLYDDDQVDIDVRYDCYGRAWSVVFKRTSFTNDSCNSWAAKSSFCVTLSHNAEPLHIM